MKGTKDYKEQYPQIESMTVEEKSMTVTSPDDIIQVRKEARLMAEKLGFTKNDQTLIATAVSEICRNVIDHAEKGVVFLNIVNQNPRIGVRIKVTDSGPGIVDLSRALEDGYSTTRGTGLGLPGSKRLMDEFEIDSVPGEGTEVIMLKWTSA